jgi:hypothetical protein
VAWSGSREKKLNKPEPVWQEGIGSLLLLAAAQQTGLLERLAEAVMQLADPSIAGLNPPNPAVVTRLVFTLLFLPVAGLARTWDLGSYTGTMLALLTGRERAYSQRYTERFLARLAQSGAAQCLTEAIAKWTWWLWQKEQVVSDQPSEAIFYVDGHHKAVYSDVLVPRGPVGKLGGKILGCRELVVLHDDQAHPLLATTHRGDHHLTIGLPHILQQYEQAIGQAHVQSIVVDREGMAANFLAQQKLEGRQIVTLLRANQYKAESSFEQVGPWQPWRSNRHDQMICEVASARFTLRRSKHPEQPLQVNVALIRDWRKEQPAACVNEAGDEQDWRDDLTTDQTPCWEDGWQAAPAPPVPTTPKLIAVITTGTQTDAVELAQAYFQRWNCQENSIRDWLIPLNLDVNHGYAKEHVVNSEQTKRQAILQGRVQRLERFAQASRARLVQLVRRDQYLQEQVQAYEQRSSELSVQVLVLQEAGQTEARNALSLKAQQAAIKRRADQHRVKLEKNALQRKKEIDKCQRYCQELPKALRRQEDLQAQARDMYELDHAKDQIMTLFKLGLANLGMWVRDQYFGEDYHHCGWQRLLPFFKLGGWITATASEVKLEVCAFNNRALLRDLEELSRKVNEAALTLPDGRRLLLAVGKRLRACLDAPLANTG